MDKGFGSIIDESISLELNVSRLYAVFYNAFEEDEDFWWKLTLEEKNHAALIRSGKNYFRTINRFPEKLLHDRLEDLMGINERLISLIEEFKENPPSREQAFNLAYRVENSAGELHFQEFMEREPGSKIDEIFQQLNRDDVEHGKRIRDYMKEHGIPLHSGPDQI